MRTAVSLMDGTALRVIGGSNVIPRHPPFIQKEEALPACEKLLHEIYHGPERTDYCTDLNVLQGKAYEKPC